MSPEAKHELREQEPTRRPWEIYDFGGQVKHFPKTIIVAPAGESICEIAGGWPRCTLAENEANAALIVRAVNNHDALVEALLMARPIVDDIANGRKTITRKQDAAYVVKKIDAALAAARG